MSGMQTTITLEMLTQIFREGCEKSELSDSDVQICEAIRDRDIGRAEKIFDIAHGCHTTDTIE